MSVFTQDEILRYSRHFSVNRVGADGQQKLKSARVLLVGAGGIGSPAALYLAAMGVGHIGLVDHDTVDLSNLQRQILYRESDVGEPKLAAATQHLTALNSSVELIPFSDRLTAENARQIIAEFDIVIDGTDNYPTRYLVNDACAELNKPLISASVFQFSGQVGVYHYEDGGCYRCLYPSPPPPGLIPNCAAAGVLGVVPGTIALMAVTETVKILLDFEEAKAQLITYDALAPSINAFPLKPADNCPICADKLPFDQLNRFDEEAACTVMRVKEMSCAELASRFNGDQPFTLLDVREDWERMVSTIHPSEHIPLGLLDPARTTYDRQQPLIIYCRSGKRSYDAARLFIQAGFKDVYNLDGGINEWAKTQDQTCTAY